LRAHHGSDLLYHIGIIGWAPLAGHAVFRVARCAPSQGRGMVWHPTYTHSLPGQGFRGATPNSL
jgi:hypothetical protein